MRIFKFFILCVTLFFMASIAVAGSENDQLKNSPTSISMGGGATGGGGSDIRVAQH